MIIIFIFCFGIAKAHPVHVSMCNIEAEDDELTIAIKLFKDDLQLALQHNYGKIINYEDLILPANKKVIDRYINNVLKIVLNNKDSLILTYSDTEMNEEAIWFYYTFSIKRLKRIYIKNELFLDIYSDQTNLTIINYEGKQKGYRFNLRNTEKRVNLK